MVTTKGITSKDFEKLNSIMKRSNSEQLKKIIEEAVAELERRRLLNAPSN